MCGITFVNGKNANQQDFNRIFRSLKSRGESSEVFSRQSLFAGTQRLKIVDPLGGKQPFFTMDNNRFIIFNGEIFNYRELRNILAKDYHFTSTSDTEVLLYAYEKWGPQCFEKIRGQFAFIIADLTTKKFIAARDILGIVPLYYVEKDDTFYFSSTIGSLVFLQEKIHCVKPGSCRDWEGDWYSYFSPETKPGSQKDYSGELKKRLQKSINFRIPPQDTPVGVIYSGGLDSTIVLHEISKVRPDVQAFTIGSKNSEDFEISKRFCNDRNIKQVLIDIENHPINLKAVEEAIKKTELSEYLDIINGVISLILFKEIHNRGIKVVLGGDGSDELFGGYDMYKQIQADQSERLFIYKLLNLHRTELQRVDRCGMAYEVETRVPFLDRQVVELAMEIPNNQKYHDGWEKWCVRQAFKDELPEYVIKRHKNPLSHSSGIHEMVRVFKPKFKKFYNAAGFDLCEPIRKDFAVSLIDAKWDIESAITEHQSARDFSKLDLIVDSLKARFRTHVLS